MVTRSGRHYGDHFTYIIGVMLGYPLSSNRLNIVVDMVIPIWDKLVTFEAELPEGFVRAVQNLYDLLYADDRILAYATPDRIQAALDVLTGLFNCVGIQKISSGWWS